MPEGTRFAGGPSESPGFLLWRVTSAWQRAMASALTPLGLTHVQFVLLACAWWLGRSGETPNQVRVAAQAGADVKMASEVLGRLEAKGLVTRAADPADSRAKTVLVTPEGAALAKRAVGVVEDADARFFATVDAPALVTVLRGLAGVE
ncbi:MarR family winged helix-turn-helix transcriptional regulator [Humibacter ginsenosidimutans]|uniref:Winged helix-turn-helix transcriptional regulator n=1 Tax=Humibacter ginsenosidimutans TaxID=2599293 RepID=A0A5B8M4U5_9MICO|nr:MarR family winged helix-turn-helix transcriptional regulator [Humibacter ginsenosidimutans]QDZ15366.1 winged helix-turn-helix transcriptional regulator [Humibacter ginsenosidimutans]